MNPQTLDEALHEIGRLSKVLWAAVEFDKTVFPRQFQNLTDIEAEGEALVVLHDALNEYYGRKDNPLLTKVEVDTIIINAMQEERKRG